MLRNHRLNPRNPGSPMTARASPTTLGGRRQRGTRGLLHIQGKGAFLLHFLHHRSAQWLQSRDHRPNPRTQGTKLTARTSPTLTQRPIWNIGQDKYPFGYLFLTYKEISPGREDSDRRRKMTSHERTIVRGTSRCSLPSASFECCCVVPPQYSPVLQRRIRRNPRTDEINTSHRPSFVQVVPR